MEYFLPVIPNAVRDPVYQYIKHKTTSLDSALESDHEVTSKTESKDVGFLSAEGR